MASPLLLLLLGAIAFGCMAAWVPKPPVQKISVVGFAICAIVFLVLVILQVTGVSLAAR